MLLVRMLIGGTVTLENSMEFPPKLRNRDPLYDQLIPHLAFFLKKNKALILKDIFSFMFTTELFTIIKLSEQP